MATVVLDKSALLAQYNSSQPLYERLQEEVKFILNEQLKNAKIPIHAIEHRIKNFDSLIKRAEREMSLQIRLINLMTSWAFELFVFFCLIWIAYLLFWGRTSKLSRSMINALQKAKMSLAICQFI